MSRWAVGVRVAALRGVRGTGLIADSGADVRAFPSLRELALTAPSLAPAAELQTLASVERWAPTALDQQSSDACVSHALLGCEVTTLLAAHGRRAEMGSPLFAHYMGRLWDGNQHVNLGSRPRSVLRALAKHGLPTASAYPWDLRRLNRQPPISARWDAVNRRCWGDTYAITDRGEDRLSAVIAALRSGRAVALDVPSRELQRAEAVDIPWSGGTSDHYVMLIGIHRRNGRLCIRIQNSWGIGWLDFGRAYLAIDYLYEAGMVYVIDPKGAPQ